MRDLILIILHNMLPSKAVIGRIADALLERLFGRCLRLAELQGILGTARPELRSDIRSIPEQSYVIFFRYCDDEVEIVHILHASRDLVHHFDEGS